LSFKTFAQSVILVTCGAIMDSIDGSFCAILTAWFSFSSAAVCVQAGNNELCLSIVC